MRKLVMVSVLLAMLLGAAVVSAQDDASTIVFPSLVAGETLTGTFETTTMQVYAFNALQGDLVTITMVQTNAEAIDPFLILLGPRGEVVAYNDDSDDETDAVWASAIVDAELPGDGSYLVVATTLMELRASSGEGIENSEYQITMSGASDVEIPEGQSPVQLAGVQAEIGQSGDLSVTFAEPVYYVFFSAEEGQSVRVETGAANSQTPLGDTMLWVFDHAGARIVGLDDTEDGLYANVEFDAAYSGAYMAFAMSPFFFFTPDLEEDDFFGAGTFTITISEG